MSLTLAVPMNLSLLIYPRGHCFLWLLARAPLWLLLRQILVQPKHLLPRPKVDDKQSMFLPGDWSLMCSCCFVFFLVLVSLILNTVYCHSFCRKDFGKHIILRYLNILNVTCNVFLQGVTSFRQQWFKLITAAVRQLTDTQQLLKQGHKGWFLTLVLIIHLYL